MPGTIHNFHLQVAAATEIADDDEILMFDTSAGVPKTITPALLREETGAIVATTATQLTLTAASHAGKTVVVSSAAPLAVTLPAATATGNKYTIAIAVAATGTAHTITAAGSDVMNGMLALFDTSATDITAIAFAATATDKIITLNGTTKAGTVGTIVELQDVKANLWVGVVRGAATGSYATPFSAS